MRDVRDVYRQLLLDDAAGLAHARLCMPLGDVHPLDDDPLFAGKDTQNLTGPALVAAADDDDAVTLLDLQFRHARTSAARCRHPRESGGPGWPRRQLDALYSPFRGNDEMTAPIGFHRTSGANDTIFMNRRARNSRVTGPKMRAPMGSFWLVINTAALRSNRMARPSVRRISFAVRPMTARCTSPFLTRPRGIASLTETMMTSPIVAVLRFEPPSTLMHCTRRAPELSATSRFVCIWIMLYLPRARRFRCRHPAVATPPPRPRPPPVRRSYERS